MKRPDFLQLRSPSDFATTVATYFATTVAKAMVVKKATKAKKAMVVKKATTDKKSNYKNRTSGSTFDLILRLTIDD